MRFKVKSGSKGRRSFAVKLPGAFMHHIRIDVRLKPTAAQHIEAANDNTSEVNEMFDMKKVGKKIQSCRKAQNMTQLELADRLGISFQAVSNWERGESMPDISKLPELADMFGISIDELLGNKKAAEIIDSVSNDRELPENVSVQELTVVAPMLRPDQVTRAFEAEFSHGEEGQNDSGEEPSPRPKLSDLIGLAPFIDEDVLGELVREAMHDGAELSELSAFIPFLDEDVLTELLGQAMSNSTSLSELSAFAPFLDEDILGEVLEQAMNSNTPLSELSGFAPFLDEDLLARLVGNVSSDGFELNELTAFLPFLDEDLLGELARKSIKQDTNLNDLVSLAPFLDEDDLAAIAKDVLKQNGGDLSSLQHIARFLDEDTLGELIKSCFHSGS